MDRSKCEHCGVECDIGDWPFCPHGTPRGSVITDDIAGGIEIKHGLCNPDGSPRRYYSKTEITKEASRRGLVNHVEHIPSKGSDKSPHTVRWV